MKKLLLLLVIVSLLLVACEPEQPKLPSRQESIPGNYVPLVKENVTKPIPEPENITEPVINDIVPEPIPEPVLEPDSVPELVINDTFPEPDFIYSKDTFFTDVLVDLESFNPSEEEIEEVMAIASFKFKQLTGYNLEVREIYYSNKITDDSSITSYMDYFQYKLFSNKNKGLNGVIVFTEKYGATSSGGFSTSYHYPDYCNQFNTNLGNSLVYFSYIDLEHKYSTCGYDSETGYHTSSVSLPGECTNKLGTQCIFNGDYYICEDSQENYYAQDNVFVACTIVHELMHPFGELGNYDHYGSLNCNEAMGISSEEATIEDFQYYCGLCPNVYENFKNSFIEC